MNELFPLILSLIAGAVLGLIFFGGLWLTVFKALPSRYPFFWFLGSLLLRIAIVVAGFYYVTGGEFGRLAACLAGFVLMRIFILRRVKKAKDLNTSEDHD